MPNTEPPIWLVSRTEPAEKRRPTSSEPTDPSLGIMRIGAWLWVARCRSTSSESERISPQAFVTPTMSATRSDVEMMGSEALCAWRSEEASQRQTKRMASSPEISSERLATSS